MTFTVESTVSLGSQTTAHIRTGTLLGERILTLTSAGPGKMSPLDRIPVSRTASPYSLTDAVSDLTTNVAATDTQSLNQSLDVLASTIDQIAPQLKPTFDGLTRLSQSLNSRNETIADLLKNTAAVTDVLSRRSDEVNALILNANDLTAVLVDRREAIVHLLAATSSLAQQVAGIIADNENELAPTLQKINSVTAMLEKNRDNIAKAIPGLAKFQSGLSELVANGPYYVGYIPNLTQGRFLAALPRLRIRVPARNERRTTPGQCRTPRRNTVSVQRNSGPMTRKTLVSSTAGTAGRDPRGGRDLSRPPELFRP